MFTGIIKEIGTVKDVHIIREGKQIVVEAPGLIQELEIDDSIAINGVCQTAISKKINSFTVQAVHTTLEKTTLGSLQKGDPANLELSLRLNDRLGGHLVQGHVNDVGKIKALKEYGQNRIIDIEVSNNCQRYIIKEGSITIDGISLTVANVKNHLISISVIPHTFNNTILKFKKVGDKVNVEVDVLAKYLEKLTNHQNNKTNITQEWLRSKGF